MRTADKFWNSPEQQMHTEDMARRYRRRPGEGALSYIERLAVISGLMKREDCGLLSPMDDIWAGGQEPAPHWSEPRESELKWPAFTGEDTLAEGVER